MFYQQRKRKFSFSHFRKDIRDNQFPFFAKIACKNCSKITKVLESVRKKISRKFYYSRILFLKNRQNCQQHMQHKDYISKNILMTWDFGRFLRNLDSFQANMFKKRNKCERQMCCFCEIFKYFRWNAHKKRKFIGHFAKFFRRKENAWKIFVKTKKGFFRSGPSGNVIH